jgi:hypothetical protein
VSASALDHVASLAKLATRKKTLADGNSYDLFDMIYTIAKDVVQRNPHINDDELLSVNYKAHQ